MEWKFNDSLEMWEGYYQGERFWINNDNGITIISTIINANYKFDSIEQAKKYVEDYLGIN